MALDIGLSPINRTVVAKLLGASLLAFLVVLLVLCLAVYGFAVATGQAHLKEKLVVFAGSVVGSIDSGETEPDLIRSPTADLTPVSLADKKLQWFSPEGKLLVERGDLQARYPFDRSANFQIQQEPHALLFTRPAVVNGRLLGYVRIAQSLAGFDSELESLRWGLLLGGFAGLIVSSVAVLWLTSIALKPIEESFLRLKQFTDDASHELRNPIMAIKSNCSLVIRHADDLAPEYKTRLVSAIDAADQLMDLAEGLLLLARTDPNAMVETSERVNVSELVEEILERSRLQAEQKKITLRSNVAATVELTGDREQLRRVFSNLLANAISYTDLGGEIFVELQLASNQLLFKITDSGIGIAPEDLPKIFDRFWRADRARSCSAGGTGLGLAIVKSIVEQHEGKITVASTPGKGSTFAVILPCRAR